MNSKLNKISKQVGLPNTISDEVKILLSEGKRIKAIKKYRIDTGADLVEATQYIDYLKL